MSAPERIWLDAVCPECAGGWRFGDITWSDDKAQDNCPQCGKEPIEYLRKDGLPREMAKLLEVFDGAGRPVNGGQSVKITITPFTYQQVKALLVRWDKLDKEE